MVTYPIKQVILKIGSLFTENLKENAAKIIPDFYLYRIMEKV